MSSNNSSDRVSLTKTLKRGDIWAFAFGSIVGWGWVMLAGRWVSLAGSGGAVLAFVVGGLFCCIIGMTYAELAPALPITGAELVYAYRAGGYGFGWFSAWAMCFAYVAVAAWEGPAFATAVDYLIHLPQSGYLWTIQGYDVFLPWLIVAIAGTLFTVGCHYFGMKITMIFNTIACIALVVGGVVFFIGGVTLGDMANAAPMFRGGSAGLTAVLLMAPAMFVGFDVIPQAVEEMKIPLYQVGKIVVFAIILGALWYIMMILGAALGAPTEFRDNASIPVADIASYVYNSKIFGTLVIIAGIGGILTSWNAMYLGATRIIFAMARAKMLPPMFAKLHPKYESPSAAIILVGITGIAGTVFGKSALGWFVDASSLGVVVAYLTVSYAFCKIRRDEPNLERPFKAFGGMVMGVMAVIASIAFICLYMPFGPGGGLGKPQWIMVGAWTIVGIILYAAVKYSEYSKVTAAEREFLIFGKEYARPHLLKDFIQK